MLAEVFHEQLDGFTPHSLQLRCFMLGLGDAIRGISHLQIRLQPVESSSYYGVDELLLNLAEACPAVQVLQIAGNIGRSVLTAFGVSCSNLLRLEVMEGVTSEPLGQLDLDLPNLTQCTVTAPPCIDGHVQEADPCCLALMSSTSLTHLDVGLSILTLEMWQALPSGLRSLHCALQDEPHAGLQILENLLHFECYCDPRMNFVDLCSLVSILRIAPGLKSVNLCNKVRIGSGWSTVISDMVCEFAPHNIPELVYLHDRILSGLQVTSYVIGGQTFAGLNLGLCEHGLDEENHDRMITEYLAMLPPFPAITGLSLSCYSKQKSMPAIIQGVAKVFPKLVSLVLYVEGDGSSDGCLKHGNIKHLEACTSLHQLSLEGDKIDPMSVVLLCSRLPSLKVLRLKECADLSAEHITSLQQFLTEWDIDVQILHASST